MNYSEEWGCDSEMQTCKRRTLVVSANHAMSNWSNDEVDPTRRSIYYAGPTSWQGNEQLKENRISLCSPAKLGRVLFSIFQLDLVVILDLEKPLSFKQIKSTVLWRRRNRISTYTTVLRLYCVCCSLAHETAGCHVRGVRVTLFRRVRSTWHPAGASPPQANPNRLIFLFFLYKGFILFFFSLRGFHIGFSFESSRHCWKNQYDFLCIAMSKKKKKKKDKRETLCIGRLSWPRL